MSFVDLDPSAGLEHKRSLALAAKALSGLRGLGLAPTPRNYEIWYTYSVGTNSRLNADIDVLLKQGEVPDEARLDGLYETHFGTARLLGKVQTIGSGLSGKLGEIACFIEATLGSASSYGRQLDLAAHDLAGSDNPATILSTVQSLVAATVEMQSQNLQLSTRLSTARQEIAGLQRDLQTIRLESRLDPLTELGNRKLFDEAIGNAVIDAARSAEPLCLLMIDIDHFKSFNDSYGHATGDAVLRLVAMTLKQNIKGRDVAARYGGEEFAIILPNTAISQAIGLADQLRRLVMARELKKKSTGEVIGRVTISVGAAVLLSYDTQESLIERADAYLYAAKRSGRNRVVGPDQFREAATRVA